MAAKSTKSANREAPRTTVAVQGARVHNLKNISLEIPRDRLVVVTGLSGSGKSSLAFDTIYAEGQRRYMESLSSYREAVRRPGGEARRGLRVRPLAGHLDRAEDGRQQPALDRRHDDRHRRLPEPAVRDHRSAALSRAPASRRPAGRRARSSRRSWRCPEGAEIELRAPVFKVYGEELDVRLHRGAEERLPAAHRRRQAGGHLGAGRARRIGGPAHGRGRGSARGQPKAREGDQGGHRRHAAGRRRAAAGPHRQGREQGGGRAVLPRAVQRDAPLRLRRHRAGVLRVQQPGERLPRPAAASAWTS